MTAEPHLENIKKKLTPLIAGNLLDWHGLPLIEVDNLEDLIGPIQKRTEALLGAYSADRYLFKIGSSGQEIAAFVRQGTVVMIENLQPPPLSAMEHLEQPCATLPQEILVEDFYSYEYLYCSRGLVLTVAKPLEEEGSQGERLIRCRGIRPIASEMDFGPELYMPWESEIHFC
jgi:hypothetical protein